ncbi:MAG: HDOD domain-containing protein [Bermanella sp.]|jgi:Predicted signal transduction protein
MASLIETVANDLIQQIKDDTLVLPSLPEVCLRVRDVAEDPNTDIPQLAKLISQDAGLSARIVKVANSSLMRTASEVSDLATAIGRLGITVTSNLAMGLAMEQMFQATSDVVDKRMRMIWQQSSLVASVCHVLAERYTRLQADQAMLGGLIHKIGALPVLAYAEENNALLNDAFVLDKIITKLHPIIGHHIVKAWQFPKALQNVPSQYLKFARTVDTVDYADLVTVAVLHSHANSEHPLAKLDRSNIGAFTRVGIPPEMAVSEIIDMDEEIEELFG